MAPYVDHILHRDRFWAISIASGSVRLFDLRSCCMVLSHMCCVGDLVDRILLASALSSNLVRGPDVSYIL